MDIICKTSVLFMISLVVIFLLFVFFFKQKTAYEITVWLEFRRVLFRSTRHYRPADCAGNTIHTGKTLRFQNDIRLYFNNGRMLCNVDRKSVV